MKYLLDANAVVAILRGDARFIARLRQSAPADFAIPSIVAHAMFHSAYRSQRVADARMAGQARAMMSAAGTPVGPNDVLIAGQALARDLTLVTHNVREFQRIAGLKIEDGQGRGDRAE